MRKKILQESFSVLFNFGYRKNLCIKGVCHDFFPEFLLSHSIRKLGRGTVLGFKTFCYRKNFGIRWVGGVSRLSNRNVLSHSNERVRNPSVFHQFQVSKKVMLTRGMSKFSVEIFLSRTVKNLRRIRRFG